MQTDSATIVGTVIKFTDDKGYGFIRSDHGGPDVFVHFSAINSKEKHRTLLIGQRVKFEVIQQEKGPAAHNVRVVTE